MRGIIALTSRKLKFQSLAVFLLMLLLISCKKDSIEADASQNQANEKLIPKIKLWLEDQKTDLSTALASRIDSLKSNLMYDKIRLEKYKDSKEFIVIPILEGFKSSNNSDKDLASYLVLVLKNQDSITKGNVIQYISSNTQKSAPQNTFYRIFSRQNFDCSGVFTILSITDYFLYELKFEDGKLKSLAMIKKKDGQEIKTARINEQCIDWYEQTWLVWADGTAELVSEIYVFTTCDGDCWQQRMADGRNLRINTCNGGGGGGGEGELFDLSAERDIINQVFSITTQPALKQMTFSTQEPDQQEVYFTWDVLRNAFGLWQVTSSDKAIGYSSSNPSIGQIIYDLGHLGSSISGQTFWCRVPLDYPGACIPLVDLSWHETSSGKSIAASRKSATMTVSGMLQNLGVYLGGLRSQSCTVNVN